MKVALKSDVGLVRENNEDYLLADTEGNVFLLADGMGGHEGGEVASELAVRTAHQFLRPHLAGMAVEEIPRLLAEALARAHAAVSKKGLQEPRLAGMGTTLEMLVVHEGEALICHLGDSRVYLYRGETLRQLTTDDNAAEWLRKYEGVEDGLVLRAARHMLTQAVGVSDELVPEIHRVLLLPEDLFLLCSDGLNEMLSDAEIAGVIRRVGDDLDALAAALVAEANGAGGHDNISVLLVAPEAAPVAPKLLS